MVVNMVVRGLLTQLEQAADTYMQNRSGWRTAESREEISGCIHLFPLHNIRA